MMNKPRTLKALRLLAAVIMVVAGSLRSFGIDDDPDVLDLNLDDNIATPAVPSKAKPYVRQAMDQLRRMLIKNKLAAVASRDGEVVELSIPCDELFSPMSTELKASAFNILRPVATIAREPLKYKILVAVHTDDTGDAQYADSISAARANAIDDAIWQLVDEHETSVIPYGIGKDEPIGPNTSRKSRAANRRAEIFIVPEWGLIQMSGVKKK